LAFNHNDNLYESILGDLEKIIKIETETQLEEIIKKCEYLYKKIVGQIVYDEGEYPTVYYRTRQLYDSITTEIVDNKIHIFHDERKLHYMSVGDRYNVTQQVPYWVNYGHDGLFGYYEGRRFLERAKTLIERETGLQVEIDAPKPPNYKR
jgi:hypothetical protein